MTIEHATLAAIARHRAAEAELHRLCEDFDDSGCACRSGRECDCAFDRAAAEDYETFAALAHAATTPAGLTACARALLASDRARCGRLCEYSDIVERFLRTVAASAPA